MVFKPTKGDKQEIRRETRLTRPPRLEAKAKEAMMLPVRKRRKASPAAQGKAKPQGYTDKQRKDYQLASKQSK